MPVPVTMSTFPDLAPHPGPHPGEPADYFQDRELGGAICATAEEAQILYCAAWCARPAVALEIGSYVGWTAAHIAAGLGQDGKLICIDDFSESGDGPRQMVRLGCNLERAGVADRVRVMPGHSPDILEGAVLESVDLAFVDGCHQGEQPLLDVQAVAALMAPNGVLALHDTWMPDVARACDWLVAQRWTMLQLPTPGRLAFFYQQMPDWWGEFLAEVQP